VLDIAYCILKTTTEMELAIITFIEVQSINTYTWFNLMPNASNSD